MPKNRPKKAGKKRKSNIDNILIKARKARDGMTWAKFCPACGSADVEFYPRIYSAEYECMNCHFKSPNFPEKEVKQKRK